MNTPTIYSPETIIKRGYECSMGLPGTSRYVPARAMGWPGICLRHRLRCAWMVFTGRADVLKWTGQP